MTDDSRHEEDTAFHEAGHAVMGCLLGRVPLQVSIVPDGKGMVGQTTFEPNAPTWRFFDDSPAKRHFTEQRVLTEVAGSIAHDIKVPARTPDAADEHDAYWTRELIIELVSWEDSDKYLANAKRRARELLEANWAWVTALAMALLEHKELSRAEILALRR